MSPLVKLAVYLSEITNHELYESGLEELSKATHKTPPTSPAFKALARYYIHEFVHTIQDGPLKDDFLKTENGIHFRDSLWAAYTKFEEAEKNLIAALAEHAARNFITKIWHNITENKPEARRKALKVEEVKVLSILRTLHQSLLRAEIEDDLLPEHAANVVDDPLREPKEDLRTLLADEEIADEERSFRGQFLLPALTRLPLYIQEAAPDTIEGYDERKWLNAWIPQKLFYGTCDAPDSLAAFILELKRKGE